MAESEEDRHLKLTGEFDCVPEPLPTLRHSDLARHGAGGEAALPRGARSPSAPPSRTASTTTSPKADAVHARGPRAHRGGDARDRRRRTSPFEREEMPRERGDRASSRSAASRSRSRSSRASTRRRVSLYRQGDFVDLCRGPHVPSTGPDQGLQAPVVVGRLLARATRRTRCSSASTAPPGSPRRSSTSISGGSRRPRSATTASSGASSTCSTSTTSRRARRSGCPNGMVLVRELEKFAREVARRARLPGDLHADPREQEALGAVRALGALQRQHVQGRGRGARPSASSR